MIKRLWLTIKFLFTGKVDGYISEHEALEMKIAASTYWEKYSDKIINESTDNFWRRLCKLDIRDVANRNIQELDSLIKNVHELQEQVVDHTSLWEFNIKYIKNLESIKDKLKHDIELLG